MVTNATKEEEETLKQSLLDGTSLDAHELVFTVDKDNNPTPKGAPRHKVRLENLWHRATYIVVLHKKSHDDEDDDKKQPPGGGDGDDDDETFILVQRRSNLKDYCPSKLDPAPGGVLGYGESYEENAQREILEEMGISVQTIPSQEEEAAHSTTTANTMRRLFSFPYEDHRVRCWGDLYEVVYRGSLEDIKIQEEEVDEILRYSVSEIQKLVDDDSDQWMPDGLFALQLYLKQRCT